MPEATALIIPAFIAGILMFLAPCTFPLVPAYLGVISGVSTKDLGTPESRLRTRFALVRNALLFVGGFSLIFILFGTAAGWGGQFIFQYRGILEKVAGVFIMGFGAMMLGAFKLPIFTAATSLKISIPGVSSRSLNSFLVGSAFGVGWTPCVGPILGSILLLATTSGTASTGALLLGVFSLGLAIPFVLVALAMGSATRFLNRLSRIGRKIDITAGVFLIFLGGLIFSGNFVLLIAWGYRLFGFLEYDRLLDYL